jgi:hypothetical protein
MLEYDQDIYIPVGSDSHILNVIRILLKDVTDSKINYGFMGKNPDGDQYIFKNGDVLQLIKPTKKSNDELQREFDFTVTKVLNVITFAKGLILFLYAILSLFKSTMYGLFSNMPDFMLLLVAISGSRKTAITSLLYDFHSHKETSLSFRDTIASTMEGLKGYRDCVAVIDDKRPSISKADAVRDLALLDKAARGVGDRNSGGKKMRGAQIVSGAIECLPLITMERNDSINESGDARAFVLNMSKNDVDLNILTEIQSNPKLYDNFLDSVYKLGLYRTRL